MNNLLNSLQDYILFAFQHTSGGYDQLSIHFYDFLNDVFLYGHTLQKIRFVNTFSEAALSQSVCDLMHK